MKTTISHQFDVSASFDVTAQRYTMSMGVIKRTGESKEEKQMPSRFGIIKPRSTSQEEPVVS